MYEYEKQKLYNYLGSELVALFKEHKVYIAGGVITSLFCNRDINDIDVYFKSPKLMTDFYEGIWQTSYWITFHTKKSSTCITGDKKIQLIYFDTFDKAEDIFEKFDFTVCMGVFDFETEKFIVHPDFLRHNSQRILKFNKTTKFPLISVLRIYKYKEKGYEISRAETIKILLACVDLKITSYDELFDQVSAMSEGENLEDIIDTSRPFDIMDIIEQIENHSGKEKNTPKSLPFENLDDLLISITNKKYKPQYIKLNDGYIRLVNGKLKISDISDVSEEYLIDANQFFKGYKFYKFVKKNEGQYFSFYDGKFEYKMNEVVEPKNNNNNGIYCGAMQKVNAFTYSSSKNGVLIELQIDGVEDIKRLRSLTSIELKRCKFIREVPKEEWNKYSENEESDEISF